MSARQSCSILLLLLMLAFATPALAIPYDGVEARINTEIITMYDVRQAATPFMIQQGMDPATLASPDRRAKLYRQVLDDLIERKLLAQEAKKLGITVADEELDRWLGYMRQEQGLSPEQFQSMVEQYGMAYNDYKEMMRENLLRTRISQMRVGSKVSITDAEVEEAYRQRYGALGEKDRYLDISHILFQPTTNSAEDLALAYAQAEEALARLDAGESFGDVAASVSNGPSAKSRGVLGTFRRGELDPEFEQVVFDMEVGKHSPIVKTKFGYHIILVTGIDDRVNPDVEDRLDQLRGELRQRAMERQFKSYVQGLKTRAFVKVNI